MVACDLCGKDPGQVGGYLRKTAEGVWRCHPSCDCKLTDHEKKLTALRDRQPGVAVW